MTRDEALCKLFADWKISPEIENLVSAAFERGPGRAHPLHRPFPRGA